ncbi:MAG: cytochrome c biogenesis protein CcsA [Bdellovibrionales bacterium]|nr:cytochrome c biogenesis protein CcsA [Bdellovibrionales bacterium]
MKVLFVITACFIFGAFSMVFFYAPSEATQGIVQKIFYIHVSSAMTMYLGFFITFLSGLMYLGERRLLWDEVASSCAEVAWVFCSIVLLTGPIWAKPIWGTWWTWEPRLTTTFLLWLMYSAYLFTRSAMEDSSKKPLVSAVIGIVAFIDVPLIHYSVKLWRGIHPSVVSTKGGLPYSMKLTLAVCTIAFFLLFFVVSFYRFRLEQCKNRLKYMIEEGN